MVVHVSARDMQIRTAVPVGLEGHDIVSAPSDLAVYALASEHFATTVYGGPNLVVTHWRPYVNAALGPVGIPAHTGSRGERDRTKRR